MVTYGIGKVFDSVELCAEEGDCLASGAGVGNGWVGERAKDRGEGSTSGGADDAAVEDDCLVPEQKMPERELHA